FEHHFGFGIAARDRIAHHHEVRSVVQVRLGVAVHHLDSFFHQETGHGWIEALVRAGNGEPFVFHRSGDGSHGGAADADEMHGADFGEHALSVFGWARAGRKPKLVREVRALPRRLIQWPCFPTLLPLVLPGMLNTYKYPGPLR